MTLTLGAGSSTRSGGRWIPAADYAVRSEDGKFMARGLFFLDDETREATHEATVTCEDGSVVACVINVSIAWRNLRPGR